MLSMNQNTKPAASTQLSPNSPRLLRSFVIESLRIPLLFVTAMLATCLNCSLSHAGPSNGPDVPPWKFIVIGDSRGASESEPINTNIMSELVQEILRNSPDFVLVSGDLVYSGNLTDFQAWHDALSEVYAAGIAVYPVMGNHDDPDPDGFIEVFGEDIPDNGPPLELNRTYFIAHSNALVLALDFYATPDVVNMDWVRSVLATNTLPHVFAMGHMPAFKVAHYDCLDNYLPLRDDLWNSLKSAGGRIYFAGHDHFYDHMRVDDGDSDESNDLHQIIVGTAGAPLYGDTPYNGANTSWMPTRILHEANFGYVLVEVNGTDATLTWNHRAGVELYLPKDSWSYSTVRLPRLHIEQSTSESSVVRLWFAGEEGVKYVIESSSDLVNWTSLGIYTAVGGIVETNCNPSGAEAIFFRVRR